MTVVYNDLRSNPVVGCICSVANENHAHVRHARWPDRAGAIRDNENFDLETRRHAVDLVAHRARISIDVNVSQILVRFLLSLDWTRGQPTGDRSYSMSVASTH